MLGGPSFIALLLAQPIAAAPLDFERSVLPLLQAKCVRCHGGERTRAGLDLRGKAGLLAGGDGGRAVVPGAPEKSLLWIQVAADKMPPGKAKLTAAEKKLLRAWIEGGAQGKDTAALPPAPVLTAADRDFWAFKPPVRPPLPAIRQSYLARSPIDVFLLARLEKVGLTFSPEADRRALLRRATLSLTGLPPTPDEMKAFAEDGRPDAWERVVDRLLASPRYGERWGRHWLDVAGYADSEGILDADYVRSAAWRYRDYVIRAFNADKPYDRFLQEQIAGDELTDYWSAYQREKKLPASVVEGLIATGFLRCASDTSRPDFVNIKNAPGYYFQTLDDTVKIVSSATLGLTLGCAKCHAHKFDPIPHREYYQAQAIFTGAYRPSQWVPQVQRRLLQASRHEEEEAKRHNATIDTAIAGLRKKQAERLAELSRRLFEARLAALPAVLRDDVRSALAAPPAKRTEVQRYLAGKFDTELRPRRARSAARTGEGVSEGSRGRAGAHGGHRDGAEEAHHLRRNSRAVRPARRSADPPVAPRRLPEPGAEVKPGVLTVLATPEPFRWAPPGKEARTSGRRLAFARWLTQPGHPLTARVLVNRLWMHHFGEGLVLTPENFGRSGALPSHPELLDWLAMELVRSGWSIKHVHRLILLSTAYRQASTLDPAGHALARKVDPDNRLLWRQRLRRLEAEALRDAILAVSGTLNASMFGPPVPMVRRGDGEVVTPPGEQGNRRSVYLQVRRSQPLTILRVFDQPVIETNCTRRPTSTVASQALVLLNSDFLTAQGEAFAARLLAGGTDDLTGEAVKRAFGRPATPRERRLLGDFLTKQAARHGGPDGRRRALADVCQMLLSANEFAYVD